MSFTGVEGLEGLKPIKTKRRRHHDDDSPQHPTKKRTNNNPFATSPKEKTRLYRVAFDLVNFLFPLYILVVLSQHR